MNLRRPFLRPSGPARWRRLWVGLLATLALSLQGGFALAHTHAATSVSAVTADISPLRSADQDQPGQPAQHEGAAQCPLSHSPLSHGGILAADNADAFALVLYSADNARPPSQAPPTAVARVNPPVRGPPQFI